MDVKLYCRAKFSKKSCRYHSSSTDRQTDTKTHFDKYFQFLVSKSIYGHHQNEITSGRTNVVKLDVFFVI